MYRFKGEMVDLEQLRTALRSMSDSELLQFEEATVKSFPSKGGGTKPSKDASVPLLEARAEWKRRKG